MIMEMRNSQGPSKFVQCDICNREGFDADTRSFDRVKQHMRSRGWQTFPKAVPAPGERVVWRHACPGCAREHAGRIQQNRDALRIAAEQREASA